MPLQAHCGARCACHGVRGTVQELGVPTEPTDMSFGVSLADRTFEWASTSLSSLFATPSSAVSPAFYTMIKDLLRFNK